MAQTLSGLLAFLRSFQGRLLVLILVALAPMVIRDLYNYWWRDPTALNGDPAENLLVTALVVMLAMILARIAAVMLMLRPVAHLTAAVRRLAAGDFDARVTELRPQAGELGELAQAFNGLATDLREREHQLTRANARIQALVAGAGDGILTLDDADVVISANGAAGVLFGVADPVGQPMTDLIPELPDLPVSHGETRRLDLTGLRADGTTFPADVMVSTMVVGGERLHAVIVRDISAYRQAMDTLRAQSARLQELARSHALERERAESASRAKSRFLSSMSHELRTPLNAVLGFGQLLHSDQRHPLSPRQREYVDHILEGGSHLLDLVDRLLDLSRMEHGNVALDCQDLDPLPVVRNSVGLIRPMAEARPASLVVDLPPELPAVRADPVRLKQMLVNLMTNAVKYNRDGGTVTITAAALPGVVRFSVSDTGLGIPAHLHDQLFSPFSRLGVDAAGIEGVGIGLTITRELAEAMGGRVGFLSHEGEGSTFWFDLPLAADPAGA